MDAGEVTVMLVEDEPEFRALVAAVLDDGPFNVQAADLDSWPDDAQTACPDVLLLDLSLAGHQPPIEHIPRIAASCPTTMIAALTSSPAEELEKPVLRTGAFVFYEKDAIAQLPAFIIEDLALFHRALTGEDVIAPSATTRRRTSTPAAPRAMRTDDD